MLIRQFADGLEFKNDLPIADEVNEDRLLFMDGTIAKARRAGNRGIRGIRGRRTGKKSVFRVFRVFRG
jgi:hypothetical protein